MQRTLTEKGRVQAAVYYALAEALSDPVPDIHRALLEATTAGAQTIDSSACRKAAVSLAALPVVQNEVLARRYTRVLNPPNQRPLALYESLHRRGHLIGQVTHQVANRYRALGLTPSDGELPDHASVELAYLGHLAMVGRLHKERRDFLCTHAGRWLPDVGQALRRSGDPFYSVVGGLLREFLAEEMDYSRPVLQNGARIPVITEPGSCTLCGLCASSCSLRALQVTETERETLLTLNPMRCVGCNRCVRICPEEVLVLPDPSQDGSGDHIANEQRCHHPRWHDLGGSRILCQSTRAKCPICGRPTVSQAELTTVFARLQPDPVMQQQMSLCVECKSKVPL